MALEHNIDKMLQRPYSKAFKCLWALSNMEPLETKEGGTMCIPDLLITSITPFGFTKETETTVTMFSSKEKVALMTVA
jgi:hypothetical protein